LGGYLLQLGIQEIQSRFLKFYYTSVEEMLPSQYFLIAIRELIRAARGKINQLYTPTGDPFL
jgi:hypothetical protein